MSLHDTAAPPSRGTVRRWSAALTVTAAVAALTAGGVTTASANQHQQHQQMNNNTCHAWKSGHGHHSSHHHGPAIRDAIGIAEHKIGGVATSAEKEYQKVNKEDHHKRHVWEVEVERDHVVWEVLIDRKTGCVLKVHQDD